MPLTPILKKIENGQNLEVEEARDAFDRIFTGEVPATDIAALLGSPLPTRARRWMSC